MEYYENGFVSGERMNFTQYMNEYDNNQVHEIIFELGIHNSGANESILITWPIGTTSIVNSHLPVWYRSSNGWTIGGEIRFIERYLFHNGNEGWYVYLDLPNNYETKLYRVYLKVYQ